MAKVQQALSLSQKQTERYLADDRIKEQLGKSLYLARQKIEQATPVLVDMALNMIMDENVGSGIKATLINSLLDRAGITTPKTAIQVNINTEISDRARQILAQSVEIPHNLPINTTAQTAQPKQHFT